MYDAELETIHVTPAGRDLLAFSYAKPTTWKGVVFASGNSRVSDPKYFEPLAMATSPDGAAMFTVGVRPLPPGGATKETLSTFCWDTNTQIDAVHTFNAGTLPGTIFHLRQRSGASISTVRKIYVADGPNLFSVSVSAPQATFDAMEFLLSAMIESFRVTRAVRQAPAPLHAAPTWNLPAPAGWNLVHEGPFAIFSQGTEGARIRVGRLPVDPNVFVRLQKAYAATNPHADPMFNVVDGVGILAFANVRVPENGQQVTRFRAYFVQPIPNESAMLIAQVTVPEGYFHSAMSTCSQILNSFAQHNGMTIPALPLRHEQGKEAENVYRKH